MSSFKVFDAFYEPLVNSPNNDGVGGGVSLCRDASRIQTDTVRARFSHCASVINQKEFLVEYKEEVTENLLYFRLKPSPLSGNVSAACPR